MYLRRYFKSQPVWMENFLPEPRMQQKLAIALGAQDGRIDHLDSLPAEFRHFGADSLHRHLVGLGITDDPALANAFAPHLELRLHQHHQLESATRTFHHRWQNERRRNERHVHRDHADRTASFSLGPYLLRREIPRIGLLQQPDPWIAAQLHVDLAVAGIDRDYLRHTVLQQTVGEAARGRPDVHANLVAHINVPVLDGTRQLQPTAADERHLVAQNSDDRLVIDTGAGLLDLLLID